MARASTTLEDQMEAVAHRAEFIELLDQDGPLATRDIVEELDHSRSTVTRALRDLRDAGLIEKTDTGYTATLPGVLATDQYRQYETASEAILTSKDLLSAIPNQYAPSVDLLIGADTISADTDIPVRPLEAISDRVRNADTVHVYLPTLVNTHLLRVWHQAVIMQTIESDAIFKPELLTALKGQYPHLLSEMATRDEFSAFATSGPPYGVVLTTTGDKTTVSVIVYESDAAVYGVVTNESPAAVEWARNEFERLKRDATEVTADLDALSAAVTDGLADQSPSRTGPFSPSRVDHDPAGHALPLDLEADGFVRLSSEYFSTHNQASPAVSWRTGFTLAEVHAGHAVDRVTENGQNLTDYLIEQLRAGDNHVVLGPPGSGKSTICMAVACDWYTRKLGPVLYRERGSGEHFTSTAMLEAYLRQTDGHTLVVVEDAVRDEANAIFDVMQALDEDKSVTFLLDARSNEWQDPETGTIDARRDGYRRTAINSITVPNLDEYECTRFVTQFSDLVDTDLGLTGNELFALVQEGTDADGDDSLPAGDVLIAQHYLTRQANSHIDANREPPTALDEAVRQTYQTLANAEPRFSLKLAVLVNIFNAAGLPVTSEYLYAIASDDYGAVDEALSLLEGDLLFESARSHAGGPTTYRTRHEQWSQRFLNRFRDHTPTQRARNRFGQCITEVLALADNPDQRHQIKQHLGGRTPHLHQIEANPENWADETVARIFSIGRSNSSLASLFGETSATQITLPEACSKWTDVQQAYWRGEMNRRHGDYDRAKREFRTLRERAETVDFSGQQGLQHAIPGVTRRHHGSDEDEPLESSAQREHWRAISLAKLGQTNIFRGELESATKSLEESLAIFREIGDRHGEVRALTWLGEVHSGYGDIDTATEYFEESLDLCREIGDRHGETKALLNKGAASVKHGDQEVATESLKECLTHCRELGDRHREARTIELLGYTALKRDAYGEAKEYLEESLTLYRELGRRPGEARALINLGSVTSEREEMQTAEEYYQQSLSLSRDLGIHAMEGVARIGLGAIARKRGELDTAVEYCEEALEMFREMDVRHKEAESLKLLGEVARERGELSHARDRFVAAADLFIETGAGVNETASALTNVVDVCEQQGGIDAALNWCDRAIEFAEQRDREGVKEEFTTRRSELVDTDER